MHPKERHRGHGGGEREGGLGLAFSFSHERAWWCSKSARQVDHRVHMRPFLVPSIFVVSKFGDIF